MNGKDEEFGYFERMERKKGESDGGDRRGNHGVGNWRGDRAKRANIVVFAVDDPGSDRLKTTRPKTGNEQKRDGPFSTGNCRESFDEVAGVVAYMFAYRDCPV